MLRVGYRSKFFLHSHRPESHSLPEDSFFIKNIVEVQSQKSKALSISERFCLAWFTTHYALASSSEATAVASPSGAASVAFASSSNAAEFACASSICFASASEK
jgi:hypothetical protein